MPRNIFRNRLPALAPALLAGLLLLSAQPARAENMAETLLDAFVKPPSQRRSAAPPAERTGCTPLRGPVAPKPPTAPKAPATPFVGGPAPRPGERGKPSSGNGGGMLGTRPAGPSSTGKKKETRRGGAWPR